jgi:ParB/RepB/Spo0J family partition protein
MTTHSDGQTVLLDISQLKHHPRNMRRFYPIDEVRQMGESIHANGGLIQPMLVVPPERQPKDGEPDCFYVVDGNMRLAAGRFLGAQCPPLAAMIVEAGAAEQRLMMITANTLRFDVDPVSEGLHYRSLMRDDGLTTGQICDRTGANTKRVYDRLKLTELDAPIQTLVAHHKLSHDYRVAVALLGIPDAAARVKLAEKLAEQKATIPAILAACTRLCETLANPKSRISAQGRSARRGRASPRPDPRLAPDQIGGGTDRGQTPMLALARQRARSGDLPPDSRHTSWPGMRAAARQMCDACDIKTTALKSQIAEPAWSLISHAAHATCANCNLRELETACAECPGVEFLRRILDSAEKRRDA